MKQPAIVRAPWGKITLLQIALCTMGEGNSFSHYLLGKVMWFIGVTFTIYITVLLVLEADKMDKVDREKEKN